MNHRRGGTLVLAMGNDILSDDGVGLHAARMLRLIAPSQVDFIETAEAGFVLLEYMEGYQRVLLLDAVKTGNHPAGTILPLSPEAFEPIGAPSPHYAGLPDLKRLAVRSGILYPEVVQILAMEVEDPFHIGETLSPAVALSLQEYVRSASCILNAWQCGPCAPA